MTIEEIPELKELVYSGRGVIVGMTPNGNSFIATSLTGRSASSQARRYNIGEKTEIIRTEPTDKKELEAGNAALLLYPAIASYEDVLIASNGAQTKLIYSRLFHMRTQKITNKIDYTLQEAFINPAFEYDPKTNSWIDLTTFEPDAPINTPRISAIVCGSQAMMHIARKGSGEKREVRYFALDLVPGSGHVITTYNGGNEKPVLLPFQREKPIMVQIPWNDIHKITAAIYDSIKGGMNPEDNYRVGAAAKLIQQSGEIQSFIMNRTDLGE